MSITYNVLIIDDHPIVVDGFKNTLSEISNQDASIKFKVYSALDCETAFHRIEAFSKSQDLDLVILDISLPPNDNLKIQSGEDLGVLIRQNLPKAKIIVCTFYTTRLRLLQILNQVNPIGFVNKGDMSFLDYVAAVQNVLANKKYYSQTIINAIVQKSTRRISLDKLDILILKELANGAKMKELIKIVPLTKSGVEKRTRLLKQTFEIHTRSNRDLILMAKSQGFIS